MQTETKDSSSSQSTVKSVSVERMESSEGSSTAEGSKSNGLKPVPKKPGMSLTPIDGMTQSQTEMIHKLAYKATYEGGFDAIRMVADEYNVEVHELVRITNTQEFLQLLKDYTFTMNYLGQHQKQQDARLENSAEGSLRDREAVMRVFMQEQEGASLEITETRSIKAMGGGMMDAFKAMLHGGNNSR